MLSKSELAALVRKKGTQDCLWTRWQDMEFKMTDFMKVLQSEYSTVLWPHGAASLWDKTTLNDILHQHDTIFHGEDTKMGIYLMLNGYRMIHQSDQLFDTETPNSVIGEMPNYYHQRVRSWDLLNIFTLRNISNIDYSVM